MFRTCHRHPTHPAPMIITLSAMHMHAPSILFYWYLALRTLMSPNLVCPTPVNPLLFLLASETGMHREWRALETEDTIAFSAGNFTSLWILDFYHGIFTVWVGAELLGPTLGYLSIFQELLILSIESIRAQPSDLLLIDFPLASVLWTLNVTHLPSLSYLVLQVRL
jgi:hypothetical protein